MKYLWQFGSWNIFRNDWKRTRIDKNSTCCNLGKSSVDGLSESNMRSPCLLVVLNQFLYRITPVGQCRITSCRTAYTAITSPSLWMPPLLPSPLVMTDATLRRATIIIAAYFTPVLGFSASMCWPTPPRCPSWHHQRVNTKRHNHHNNCLPYLPLPTKKPLSPLPPLHHQKTSITT